MKHLESMCMSKILAQILVGGSAPLGKQWHNTKSILSSEILTPFGIGVKLHISFICVSTLTRHRWCERLPTLEYSKTLRDI